MFTHIVAPMDGSSLSKTVIPYVRPIARAFSSKVILLHVVNVNDSLEPLGSYRPGRTKHANRVGGVHSERYLDEIEKSLNGIDVSSVVCKGHPADVIVAQAKDMGPDTLIIMSTHGRSGLGRWMLGSVTDKVLHSATNPVLVIRPTRETYPEDRDALIDKLIVPLDGTQLAEEAIPTAKDLALRMGLPITVIRVVPMMQFAMAAVMPAGIPPGAMAAEDEVRRFLGKRESDFRAQGVQWVSSELRRGNSADQIAQVAASNEGNLVVMTTKARSGMRRAFLGSVADRIVRSSAAPVLLVNVRKDVQ